MQSIHRIRWQCRRGLLELDILLNAFLDTHYAHIHDIQKSAFLKLLNYPDAQLLYWLTGKIVANHSFSIPPKELQPILAAIKQYPYTTVYIALGSNLNHPTLQLETAIGSLRQLPDTCVVSVSSFYKTAPVRLTEQPDFMNAVVCLNTKLSAKTLLSELQHIEHQQGRIRTHEKNGPRTLDLDILMYGLQVIREDGLSVPHPRLLERRFVLEPWVEIAVDCVLPDGESIRECLEDLE